MSFSNLGELSTLTGWTLWNRRRPLYFDMPDDVYESDKAFINANSKSVCDGILSVLDRACFSVNPALGVLYSSNKINQIRAARSLGMNVPATIISNNYDVIMNFSDQHNTLCTKPLISATWKSDDQSVTSMTSILPPIADIDRRSIELVPAIYQSYIEKEFEVRITIFGNVCVATKIDSQRDASTMIDWRASFNYLKRLSSIEPPLEITAMCKNLMKALNLRFGTMDFIVTPENKWVFLEINESGQFIWQQEYDSSCQIIEPFARFLASQDEEMTWKPSDNALDMSVAGLSSKVEEHPVLRQVFEAAPPPPDAQRLYVE